MPDKYLVSEEKSEEEKEYERCRKELEQLKNRQPKPHITFKNNMNELRFHQTQTTDINTELNEIVTKIKNEHPHINRPSTTEELDTKGVFQLEKMTQIFTTLQINRSFPRLGSLFTTRLTHFYVCIKVNHIAMLINSSHHLNFQGQYPLIPPARNSMSSRYPS